MPIDLNLTTSTGGALGSIGRGIKSAAAGGGPDAGAFAESLGKLIENVDSTAAEANQAVTNMVDKNGDVHEAMIALQKAETALQMTVQIRNKLVQAYQDIMRMPI
jgi:flagellar hook-basal body complex protein FliE